VTLGKTGRRKILLLAPRWPYPVLGGDKLRIWQLARAVGQHHDVTLLSLCSDEAEMTAVAPDDGVFSEVHRVFHPRWRSWLQVVAALPRRTPLQIAYFANRQFRDEVTRLAPQHDLLWCHLVRTASYAKDVHIPRWLEMTDAISMGMERAAGANAVRDARRAIYGLEADRLRAYEVDTQHHFELISLVSEVDRNVLFGPEQTGRARTLVIPNGFGPASGALPPLTQRPPGIALIGQMSSLPNRDALWFFVEQVLPLVRRRIVDAKLHVIGPVPQSDTERLKAIGGVVVHGVLPDLASGLACCRVGVCPVRMAAGVQNKNLDYMAHELATVTSPAGLEGLAAVEGDHLLVARDPGDWSEKVCALLTDESLNNRLARAGRMLVEDQYRWDVVSAPALAALDQLLAGAALPRGISPGR